MSTTPLAPTEGGCLCGNVRYRVEGPIEESAYCHCRTCQQQSGAPVVAWFAVSPKHFALLKGTPKKFRASDRAAREFCGDCGTYLLFREDDETATLGVNTATLDEPDRVPPTFHIWHRSHIKWFDTADNLPRFQKGKSG
jgi:hypothetical protein